MKKDDERRFGRRIGMRLHDLRIARGMSQKELAEALGVTFQQIQKYEGGINVPSPWKLNRLAEIFVVPLVSLFGEEEKPPVQGEMHHTRLWALMGRLRRIDARNPDAFTAICELARSLDTES